MPAFPAPTPVRISARAAARVVDLVLTSFSLAGVAFVVSGAVRLVERPWAMAIERRWCEWGEHDAPTKEILRHARACFSRTNGSTLGAWIGELVSTAPGLVVAAVLVTLPVALLWQVPRVRRGASLGQRAQHLHHVGSRSSARAVAVVLWRQAPLLLPFVLVLFGWPWQAVVTGTVGATVALGCIPALRGVSERVAGQLVVEPTTYVAPAVGWAPAPWAPPAAR